jgi:MYXO-CTERM domain-containing protein
MPQSVVATIGFGSMLPSLADPTGTFYLVGSDPSSGSGGVYVLTLGAAATPLFSPAGGSYQPGQTIALSDVTPNATIYYTTDGSMPTSASAVYSGPIHIAANETVRAIAAGGGYASSSVSSASYTMGSSSSSSSSSGGGGALGGSGLLVLGLYAALRVTRRTRTPS